VRALGLTIALIGYFYVFGARTGQDRFGVATILDRLLVPVFVVPLVVTGQLAPQLGVPFAVLDPALAVGAWIVHARSSKVIEVRSMTALAIDVENPATGEALARIPSHDASGVGAAVAWARAAEPAWAALHFTERKRLLRRLAHRLATDPDVSPILMRESGKPRFEAEVIEVLYVCEMTRFATGRAGRLAMRDDVRSPLNSFFERLRSRATSGLSCDLISRIRNAAPPLVSQGAAECVAAALGQCAPVELSRPPNALRLDA
jgi:hypothetical protein